MVAAAARGAVAIIPAVSTGLRRGIVVGYDGSPEARTAVSLAAAEAAGRSEPLVIVHAWGEPTLMAGQSILDPMMMNALREESSHLLAEADAQVAHEFPGVVVERRSLHGSPHEALQRSARTAVELVLGTRGLRGIRRVLLGSVSHGIVLDLACPTVIVGDAGAARSEGDEGTASSPRAPAESERTVR
jgi:nucleotide-binding universal stress UspA family protein